MKQYLVVSFSAIAEALVKGISTGLCSVGRRYL